MPSHDQTDSQSFDRRAGPVPANAGIGLRHPHLVEFRNRKPAIGWVEVHAENYFGAGGGALSCLENVRRDYPLSLHGVGLSLGSAERPDQSHLASLRALADRFDAGLVSEHVAWTSIDGAHFGDLLPLPYTEESLAVLCRNIAIAQDVLGRRILVENPSTYLRFVHSTIPEWEFLAELPRRTGCGLLLDVNNILVTQANHGFAPGDYLEAIDPDTVGEIHIAGHSSVDTDGQTLCIDDHGSAPAAATWSFLSRVLAWSGAKPVLLEWDLNIPELDVLVGEAKRAQSLLDLQHGASLGQRHVA